LSDPGIPAQPWVVSCAPSAASRMSGAIGDKDGTGPVIDGTPCSSGWRIPLSRIRRGDCDASQSRSSELSVESKAALITPYTEPSTGLDIAACRTPLRMVCGMNSVAPRYARDNYSEMSASESNCSTARGVLCPVIHAQMVRPRLRAGARRQRRLVRHGVDRAPPPYGQWAQHRLGRGHPLRRTQRGVLIARRRRTMIGRGHCTRVWRDAHAGYEDTRSPSHAPLSRTPLMGREREIRLRKPR
jgi:hypothetical protein